MILITNSGSAVQILRIDFVCDADYKDKGEVYVSACFYEPGINDFICRHIAKRYAKDEYELKEAKESYFLELLPLATEQNTFIPDDIDGWIGTY